MPLGYKNLSVNANDGWAIDPQGRDRQGRGRQGRERQGQVKEKERKRRERKIQHLFSQVRYNMGAASSRMGESVAADATTLNSNADVGGSVGGVSGERRWVDGIVDPE